MSQNFTEDVDNYNVLSVNNEPLGPYLNAEYPGYEEKRVNHHTTILQRKGRFCVGLQKSAIFPV
jgi:hypothetical protein